MDTKQHESLTLKFLYKTVLGRGILKIISSRLISFLCGLFLDSRLSKIFIKQFVRKNNIKLDDYYIDNVRSFNDFFSRKIKEELRPIDMKSSSLISPCDGLMLAFNIDDDLVMPVKQSMFTISSLLLDNNLASKYKDGVCLVIRLCVDNYHRYCYLDFGSKDENKYIPGKLHTVRPIALENVNVFTENCREYTVLHTDNFSDVVQVEVGALLVGKINNLHGEYSFSKGEEKGCFLYGGSTIILLFQKNAVKVDRRYFEASKRGVETPVKMGEKLGEAYK